MDEQKANQLGFYCYLYYDVLQHFFVYNPMINKQRTLHYHFIGIGGIGMSALALLSLEKGIKVTGSDLNSSILTDKLIQAGAEIHFEHKELNASHIDKVIYSSAIHPDNPEYKSAKTQQITLCHRAELLEELSMSYHHKIAITGTHGKTTVSSLFAHTMSELSLEPSYVLGGEVHTLKNHGHHSQTSNDYFIYEADESDASLSCFKPSFGVITNIDKDHMATFEHQDQKLLALFSQFTDNLASEGVLFLGIDDSGIQNLTTIIKRNYISYGFAESAKIKALNYQQQEGVSYFDVDYFGTIVKGFELYLPGKHNVLNALSVIGLMLKLGIDVNAIQKAIANFKGVKRRFDCYQTSIANKSITLIDDYGHHPKEIAVTLEAIKLRFPKRRIIHIFQPHRYSRTHDLFNEFITVLKKPDILLLMDIYAAGEKPIEKITAKEIATHLASTQKNCYYTGDFNSVHCQLNNVIEENDIVLLQGAGDIAKLVNTWI
ncbi:UDP-N-acetylmuramate--L-alanine ligase [Fangia hongkongensis]|uniref:UDP-N-acetylmuramate--L-alanine ligase n=1 Tax=Fangia hongkongensis TaxID=270495 RepID=UPI00037FD3A9|nr:UDP-N-acetylmuramate--L-alanine ligase [Fangia hongkongensis]MBK2125141.1 UDP-N-acetylmuramate--L-alanine ligase [Fangia hongkongensis]